MAERHLDKGSVKFFFTRLHATLWIAYDTAMESLQVSWSA